MTDVERAPEGFVAQHVIGIGDDGGKLRDEFHTLPHEVFARDIVGRVVVGVEFEHTACQDIHDVGAFKLHDVEHGFRHKRHVANQQVAELLEFLRVGQTAREKQIGDFFKSETLLVEHGMHEVGNLIAPEIEFAFDGLQTVFGAFIAHHIADIGESHQDASAVFVAQAALDVEFAEEVCIYLDAVFHIVGQLVNQVFFFFAVECHRRMRYILYQVTEGGSKLARAERLPVFHEACQVFRGEALSEESFERCRHALRRFVPPEMLQHHHRREDE